MSEESQSSSQSSGASVSNGFVDRSVTTGLASRPKRLIHYKKPDFHAEYAKHFGANNPADEDEDDDEDFVLSTTVASDDKYSHDESSSSNSSSTSSEDEETTYGKSKLDEKKINGQDGGNDDDDYLSVGSSLSDHKDKKQTQKNDSDEIKAGQNENKTDNRAENSAKKKRKRRTFKKIKV